MATGTEQSGVGHIIKRGNGDGPPETFTTVPDTRMVDGPGLEQLMLDTTTTDVAGGYETFIPGLKKTNEVTFELNFRADGTQHQKLLGDFVAKTLRNFELHFPDGVTIWSFAAYVSKFQPKGAPNAVLTASVALKLSGAPTLVTA
jgi:hypothetical protein